MRRMERRDSGQKDLFRARLDQIVDMDHPLAKLARSVDWGFWRRGSARSIRTLPAIRRCRRGWCRAWLRIFLRAWLDSIIATAKPPVDNTAFA
jgi:hypothetical protein